LIEAAQLVASNVGLFAALIVERDEVSLTIEESCWTMSSLHQKARTAGGPFRVITLDVNVGLDVCGYLAPVAGRLAEAGISIVPQCAYLKDHLLVHDQKVNRALQLLEEIIADCKA